MPRKNKNANDKLDVEELIKQIKKLNDKITKNKNDNKGR